MSTIDRTPPAPPPAAADEPKKLRRSRSNRWLGGVAGGLAEYFGLHPAVYRVLFIALAFAGGTGILLYLAALLVMPDEGAEESILSEALRRHRDRPWLVIGLALLALLLVFTLFDGFDHAGDGIGLLILLLLVGGVAFIWSRAARRDRRRSAATGGRSIRWRVAAVAAIATLLAVPFAAAGIAISHAKGGLGDRVERPATVADLEDEYRLGAGELELDLHGLELPPGETHVKARLGFGELHVIVPADAAVRATGKVDWGEVSVLGLDGEGRDIGQTVSDERFDAAERRLVIDAHVRGGELEVRR